MTCPNFFSFSFYRFSFFLLSLSVSSNFKVAHIFFEIFLFLRRALCSTWKKSSSNKKQKISRVFNSKGPPWNLSRCLNNGALNVLSFDRELMVNAHFLDLFKTRCVFMCLHDSMCEQRFSICRLSQVNKEYIPMKVWCLNVSSAAIRQMNKVHLMG